jgi:hypothetical protein
MRAYILNPPNLFLSEEKKRYAPKEVNLYVMTEEYCTLKQAKGWITPCFYLITRNNRNILGVGGGDRWEETASEDSTDTNAEEFTLVRFLFSQ